MQKKKWIQKSSSFLNQIILKDMDDDEGEEDSEEKSEKSEDSEDSDSGGGKKLFILDPTNGKKVKTWSFSSGWVIRKGIEFKKGKHTIKIKIESLSFSGNTWALILGVMDANHYLNTHLGASNGWGYVANGQKNYSSSSGESYGEAYAAGDVIQIDLDMKKHSIGFRKNKKNQGVAFTGLPSSVYLAICGTTSSNGKIL